MGSERNVVMYIQAEGPLLGVLVNGEMICRSNTLHGSTFLLSTTPKVNFGGENRFELNTRNPNQVCKVHKVEIRFYDRAI
jgi:hypothetical protein